MAISLSHNGRNLFQLGPAQAARRIADILGDEFLAAARTVDAAAGPISLSGFAIDPTRAGEAKDGQYVFVNGRFVRDKVIGHALREAYLDMAGDVAMIRRNREERRRKAAQAKG